MVFSSYYHYLRLTNDVTLLQELYPGLVNIIRWHRRGTRYHIKTDPNDGLLWAYN